MPNFDRTEPQGKGLTARRLGNCQASPEMTNDEDSAWSRGGKSMRGRSGAGRRCRGMRGGDGQRGQRSQR